jgi:hypothetical protein
MNGTREYPSWGNDIDPEARAQMDAAMALPVAAAGALMPDAHVGYGLPIGGVLATDNAGIARGREELATPVARFMPRFVKMAPSGERPED